MPAVPKKKRSKGRQGKNSAHFHIKAPSLSECPQCRRAMLPHRLCKACGYYNGREVVEVEEAAAE